MHSNMLMFIVQSKYVRNTISKSFLASLLPGSFSAQQQIQLNVERRV